MSALFYLMIYILQILLPFFAIIIIYNCFKSLKDNIRTEKPLILLFNKSTKEKIPILYWENSIGRNRTSDIVLDGVTVSRDHAVLFRRNEGWIISDTNSKTGVFVNGVKIKEKTQVFPGDTIDIGGISLILKKVEANQKSVSVKPKNPNKTLNDKTASPGALLLLVTIFHFIAAFTACFSVSGFKYEPAISFSVNTVIIWLLFLITRYGFCRVNFELETLGFFLSGIGIITISAIDIKEAYVQTIAMVIGMILFCSILIFIKNPDKAMKLRIYIAIFAILLFSVNIIFGKIKNGSLNWIDVCGISIQPSELVKVAFIFVGTSTLERLQTAKNLTGFILFSALCMMSLFLMGDFGTACVFFTAFLTISFMRSGSLRSLILICSGAVLGGLMILKFKPYIVDRFSVWRHVWEHTNELGYQQTRTLTYSASGGLFGVGIGKGCLKDIFASSTDLMFGMICEEWGLLVGLSVAVCLILIGFYARKASIGSRSTFYSIASCAAAEILVFQMSLNIFGSTDILPLTGVTLPFVSLGGSSMVCVWGLLAFIKASDERTYSVRR